MKKTLRTDERAHIDVIATKAEEAVSRGEQGNLYKITKAVSDRE